jgi:hypothetical protein
MAPRTPKDPEKKPAKAKPAANAAAKPAATAAGARAAKPPLKVVEKPAAAGKAVGFKLKDLVDQVATATGAKKPDAKKAVEATLAAISAALGAGSDLALPPLGKLRIAKTAGAVLTLKLRPIGGGDASETRGAKALADTGEDD